MNWRTIDSLRIFQMKFYYLIKIKINPDFKIQTKNKFMKHQPATKSIIKCNYRQLPSHNSSNNDEFFKMNRKNTQNKNAPSECLLIFLFLLLNLFFSLALRSLFHHKYILFSNAFFFSISFLYRIIKGTQIKFKKIVGGSYMIINVLQFIINAFLKR